MTIKIWTLRKKDSVDQGYESQTSAIRAKERLESKGFGRYSDGIDFGEDFEFHITEKSTDKLRKQYIHIWGYKMGLDWLRSDNVQRTVYDVEYTPTGRIRGWIKYKNMQIVVEKEVDGSLWDGISEVGSTGRNI